MSEKDIINEYGGNITPELARLIEDFRKGGPDVIDEVVPLAPGKPPRSKKSEKDVS